ncbi:MAG TPA: cadherin-like beta sandwich domain-containing protein [Draconibacterium sp.]|nr:cadherin-like beta sandwich domain-containing protein [Draconibacterium sp.]
MNRFKSGRVLFIVVFTLVFGQLGMSCKTANQDVVTKAEYVAKISDYFEWPHPDDYNDIWKKPIDGFKDVTSTDTYGKQIEVALERGIISKDASGNFNPEKVITRGEAAGILEAAFLIDDLVAAGYMKEGKMDEPLSGKEAETVFQTITSSVVAPVQAVPVTTAVAPRRYIKLWCPTEGATIHFTRDGSEPTLESEIYNLDQMGHIAETIGTRGGSGASEPTREVVYNAFAVKDGVETSSVNTMNWDLYRPLDDVFQSDLIVKGDEKTPKVYRVYNDSESVRAMCWFIEGPESGIVYDALQTSVDRHNLKAYLDQIATKPYILIIGHEHGDHDAQLPAFLNAGIETYVNKRGWSAIGRPGGFGSVVTDPEKQKLVNDVEEGDSFDLGGGCVFEAYAMPGHANGNITINDKQSGMVFGSDNICTRAGSADNTGVAGLKTDLLLSITQQAISNFTKGGAEVKMLFTGHDEQMLGHNNLLIFEQALQQVIDNGENGCTPSLRGGNSRVTTVGDMWKDGTNWVSLSIGGRFGDDYEYLTINSTANYNAGGHVKYSVLSDIVIEGGNLVGTTVAWAEPGTFNWAGEEITVPNALPNKFDPWTYEYTIEVPTENDKITIIPTTMSTKVKEILLDGNPVGYRSENEVNVSDGQVVEISVTAPDGITTSTYSFKIEKV